MDLLKFLFKMLYLLAILQFVCTNKFNTSISVQCRKGRKESMMRESRFGMFFYSKIQKDLSFASKFSSYNELIALACLFSFHVFHMRKSKCHNKYFINEKYLRVCLRFDLIGISQFWHYSFNWKYSVKCGFLIIRRAVGLWKSLSRFKFLQH